MLPKGTAVNAIEIHEHIQSAWLKIKPFERIFIDRFYEQIHLFGNANEHVVIKDRFKVAEFILSLTYSNKSDVGSHSADVLSIFSKVDTRKCSPSPCILACAALNATVDESHELVLTKKEREAFASVHLLMCSECSRQQNHEPVLTSVKMISNS